jgi:CheY-like chemotaxis protein
MKKVKTLFIIDDDADDRELFIEALQEIDDSIICYTAHNGEDALKKLGGELPHTPDYIFLDLNMPRLNGKQCLFEIKRIDNLKHIPVIIYSTSSEQRDIEETKRLGAAHFLTKPNTFDELCNQIKYVLKNGFQSLS